MFPLVQTEKPNPLELFQIWLNLPRADKMAEPHFAMLWNQTIPKSISRDAAGREVEVAVVAGRLGDLRGPPPPPRSWAARPDTDVAIWTIKLSPFAEWTLPAARAGSNRSLYYFKGQGLSVAGANAGSQVRIELGPELPVQLVNGAEESELLLLQGRPINEQVAQYGPFVMNTRAELQQAFADYQETHFGGWPWPSDEPVHAREQGRFARHVDGRIENA